MEKDFHFFKLEIIELDIYKKFNQILEYNWIN